MEWIKVTITTTAMGIDPVSGRLLDLGINGIEISDKDDFKEFLEQNRKYWDYVDEELEKLKEADTTISLYLSDGTAGFEQLAAVKTSMQELKNLDRDNSFGTLDVVTDKVKDEDWSEIWKQYFHPIPVGEKVLIRPAWEEVENADGRVVFTVNPGMSFGTGSHPSTRFCIEELEKYIEEGDSILDLGCGSGILSIIGLLLGAKDAVAVDIDPNAIDVAYRNLALNNLPKERYTAMSGDVISDENLRNSFCKYEVVLANIVADVIIALSKYVRAFMKENGVFICSGIILERVDEVKTALTDAGLIIQDIRHDDDWAVITCR